MSDNYILVEGGLVQNNPSLPVFDMDVIGDVPVDGQIDEAIDLAKRMGEHNKDELLPRMYEIANYVHNYGNFRQMNEIDAILKD